MVTMNGEEACKEIFGKSEKDVYEMFTNDFMNYQNFARNLLFKSYRIKL